MLVDDSPFSFLMQPSNGLPIRPFTEQSSDDDLLTVRFPALHVVCCCAFLVKTFQCKHFRIEAQRLVLWTGGVADPGGACEVRQRHQAAARQGIPDAGMAAAAAHSAVSVARATSVYQWTKDDQQGAERSVETADWQIRSVARRVSECT